MNEFNNKCREVIEYWWKTQQNGHNAAEFKRVATKLAEKYNVSGDNVQLVLEGVEAKAYEPEKGTPKTNEKKKKDPPSPIPFNVEDTDKVNGMAIHSSATPGE